MFSAGNLGFLVDINALGIVDEMIWINFVNLYSNIIRMVTQSTNPGALTLEYLISKNGSQSPSNTQIQLVMYPSLDT